MTSPALSLRTLDGQPFRPAGNRPTLLVFAKADCPTCDFAFPFYERLHRGLGQELEVLGVFQSEAAEAGAFARRHGLGIPVVLDEELEFSRGFGIEVVPTLVLLAADGSIVRTSAGFHRGELQEIAALMARTLGAAEPRLYGEGEAVPETRPGCASRTLDPAVQRRWEECQGAKHLRSRRLEIGEDDDPFEFLFDAGVTDGLPVVPPTAARVWRMLQGTRRAADEVVARVPPNYAPATVEKIAVNAVMAGCRAEYLPVVIAAVEAACSEEFNMHGVLATTYFPAPLVIVNGPIRARIGMNSGINVFGQGNRANATIGRALALIVRNVGGGRPGEVDQATLGQPGKYTYCIAENEEVNPWDPLHVERGFQPQDSTVTLFAAEAPRAMVDQLSRSARGVVGTLARCMETVSNHKWYKYPEVLLVLCPEHVETIARDGWGKKEIRACIQEVSAKPLRDLVEEDEVREGIPRRVMGDDPPPELLSRRVPKFATEESIQIVVAGGPAGKFSAVVGGWVGGSMGSQMITRKIEEV